MLITGQFIFLFIIAILLTLIALVCDMPWGVRQMGEQSVKYVRRLMAVLIVAAIIGMGIENFPATLTLLVAGTGIIALVDRLFFHRKRVAENRQRGLVVENAYGFFGVLLLVWIIRSFIIQPYRVPTGSLQPTVVPGDFLVVNQFAYGLRFPIGNQQFIATGKPKRGDIVLFYWPVNPSVVFVKRLIGLPGDHIEYRNKVLYINGKEMAQTALGKAMDDEPPMYPNPEEHIPVLLKEENLDGVKHQIYMVDDVNNVSSGNFSLVVPPGSYFMMGDNRDNSDDSRTWGLVTENYLIGKAFGIWMSWDSLNHRVRWERIGLAIN